MTATALPPVTHQAAGSTQRLLGPAPTEPLPRLDLESVVALAEQSGLTGRGGAGFPSAIKIRAVAGTGRRGRAPVVVGNAMEGEPMSHKDAVLVTRRPDLVLDGLELLGRALRAKRTILAVGPETDPRPARTAAAARAFALEVAPLGGGFVAGQETALVNQLDGRPAVPRDPLVRVSTSGVGGRPTLVANAETLAHLALAARYGAAWFRSVGLPEDPGTSLFTLSGAVTHPGVVEAARGTRLRDVLSAGRTADVGAVLVGGYHGAWVPDTALDTPLTNPALAPYGATVGAGILHVLGRQTCPLHVAAAVTRYLAGESARQCGPCVNGLPRMADSLERLAAGARDPGLPREIDRLRGLVAGRGACTHPDGTSRFVASTMRTFTDHVEVHLRGLGAGHGPGRCGLEAHEGGRR